uniref:Gfo/Idh/MocA family oxidoreductase n=1 Tax=Thermofilum pendens TaxID=2269 RepID=A0A7C1T5Q0_THEPE
MGLSVAVVGVGRWGVNHVRVLSKLRGELVDALFVVDSNPSRASSVASRYGCDGWYPSVEDLLRSEKELDAAVVAVPTVHHFHVSRVLADKVHLLVEKPLAASIEEGLELLRSARRGGKLLMVGHIERFNPVVHIVKQYSASLGGPLTVEAKRVGPGPARDYTLNLGVAHDLLVHDVDVANFVLDKLPRRVYALAMRDAAFPYETEVQALYEYPEGVTAYLTASWRSSPTYKHRSISVRTPSAIIRGDYILRRVVVDNGVSRYSLGFVETSLQTETSSIEISYLQPEPLELELRNFLEAAAGRAKPAITGLEGYIALKCIVKALESAVESRPVEIVWEELNSLE